MRDIRIIYWACATVLVTVLILLLFPFRVGAQKGHTIDGNTILVNTRSHWEAWDVAGGIADISPGGSVSSKFIRKNINAALDAEKFSVTDQGGVVVGSNQQDARNLIDGDISTTWGPDTDRPLEDWGVSLSLGRLAVASKIVLRFAEEGDGDPFLQFKVLVWRHGPPYRAAHFGYTLVGTDIPNFWEIGRTVKPNKTQRVFEFVPPTTKAVTDGSFIGEPIEFVRIIVIDSDFDTAQEISKEEYDALPDDRKGAVEYYTRSILGRETLISKENYEAIDPDYKGPIRYYRREIPKLAEIEVWTPGDNINLGMVERGGRATIETDAGPKDPGFTLSDGAFSTGYSFSILGGRVYNLFEDVGALFWIDTMQFMHISIKEFFVDISDGTRAPDGTIKWTRVASHKKWADFHEFRIDPAKVRFIRTPFQNPTIEIGIVGEGNLRYDGGFMEVMLYGEGYVPEVVLTSDLIQLGRRKNLISIEWEVDTPPGTSVQLETRTGNELEEEKIYHNSKGGVISEKAYNKLPQFRRGELTSVFKPGGDWSPWSVPYRFSGEDIKSPSPREFMLIRARILSHSPEMTASLRSIRVNMSDPIADRMIGEVWPNRIETISRPADLSLFIRPSFSTALQGFDEIMIEATAGSEMELLQVRTGSDDDFESGQVRSFSLSELTVIDLQPDTLWFRLPDPIGREVDLVEVQFRSMIFSNSASFKASGQNSNSPGFWQRVDAGDATDLVNSQTTTVLALGENEIIQDLSIDPETITPNGDGVNDEMTFSFSVARVSADKELRLTIYDLSGVVVKKFSKRRSDPRGTYSIVWPGDDESGNIVPPGIYLFRIQVDADSGSAEETSADRLVHVAY